MQIAIFCHPRLRVLAATSSRTGSRPRRQRTTRKPFASTSVVIGATSLAARTRPREFFGVFQCRRVRSDSAFLRESVRRRNPRGELHRLLAMVSRRGRTSFMAVTGTAVPCFVPIAPRFAGPATRPTVKCTPTWCDVLFFCETCSTVIWWKCGNASGIG